MNQKQYDKAMSLAIQYKDIKIIEELFDVIIDDSFFSVTIDDSEKSVGISFTHGLYVVILTDGSSHS